MMRLKLYIFLLTILMAEPGFSQNLNIIPFPNHVNQHTGYLHIRANSTIATNNKTYTPLLAFINNRLNKFSTGNRATATTYINLKLNRDTLNPQAYTLNTTGKNITISATKTEGLFNGLTTLLQLIQSAKKQGNYILLPRVVINDAPRYAWRGIMLDESRHFFGSTEVKKLFDWMAFYKLNRFHWHLTDAHGWRIEIKKYPALTTVGGTGNFTDSLAPAKYYTQKQIKELVAYAAARNITIIPEIDMPGHATAATHAYPQYSGGKVAGYDDFTFNPAKTETYTFLTDVIKEINGLFHSGMIHIGGDEVALGIKAWETNPEMTAFMQKQGYATTQQLEQYFIKRIADSVIRINSRVFCWDEAADGNLPVSNTTIHWWRHNKPEVLSATIKRGYETILCPRLPLYFDFVQDSTHVSGRKWGKLYNALADVYHFPENRIPAAVINAKQVKGIQANLWSETVASPRRLNYLFFPRIAALAEAGWTQTKNKNEQLFNVHLQHNFALYRLDNVYYYDPFSPKKRGEVIDIAPKTIGLD
jgi:hexosaminidase